MKAAVLEDLEKITVKEIETPKLVDDGGMLIRVRACAVCGSDLRIFHYGNPSFEIRRILRMETIDG